MLHVATYLCQKREEEEGEKRSAVVTPLSCVTKKTALRF